MTYQEHYDLCILNGCTPKMADMLASRSAPRSLTDSVLFEGAGTLDKQFRGAEDQLDHVTKVAISRGYKPNVNDTYCPGIAAFLGDPRAFISSAHEAIKLAEERGTGLRGGVERKSPQSITKQKFKKLGDDIVDREVSSLVRKNPELKRVAKRELREAVVSRHGAK